VPSWAAAVLGSASAAGCACHQICNISEDPNV